MKMTAIVADCFNKFYCKDADSTIFKSELDESQNVLSPEEFVTQFLHCIQRLLLMPIVSNHKSNDNSQVIDIIVDYLTSEKMISFKNQSIHIHDKISDNNFTLDNMCFDKILLSIVEAIITHHNSESKLVRQNVCYIIDKLFQRIPPKLLQLLLTTSNSNQSSNSLLNNTTLNNQSLVEHNKNNTDQAVKLCNKIKQYLIVRLSDKITVVRTAAIYALKWFQNSSDSNCGVINAFVNSLQCDLCVDIRSAILDTMQLSNFTISHILQRTNDCKEEIRAKALKILSENVSIKILSIQDRIRLVKHILGTITNKSTTFTSSTQAQSQSQQQSLLLLLLKKWMIDCDQSLCQLINYLDPETYNDTLVQLFHYLFTSILPLFTSNCPNNNFLDKNLIIEEIKSLLDNDLKFLKEIDCNTSFLWYIIVKYQDYFSNDFDHIVDHVLPELTPFCTHLSEYIETMLLQHLDTSSTTLSSVIFNIKKLIGITEMMDLSDEIGRQTAYNLYLKVLGRRDLPFELIPEVIGATIHFSVNTTSTIENVIEIISDHLKPLSTTVSSDRLNVNNSSSSIDSFKSANSTINTTLKDDQQPIENPLDKKSTDELQLELANVRFELMTLKNDIDEAIGRQDFYSAAEMKTKFDQIDLVKQQLIRQLSNVNQSFRDNVQAIKDAITDSHNSLQHNDNPDETMTTQLENRANNNDEEDDLMRLDNPAVVIRCLITNSELLKQLKLRELTSSQQTLFHSLILPSIQNVDPLVRNEAVLNLGLYSIRSKEIARKYLLLMLQILQMDCESVQLTAISASFDVILAFGTKFLDEPASPTNTSDIDNENIQDKETYNDQLDTINSMLNILLNFLDCDSCNVHNLIASGMAKLLLLDRIRSSELLSKLILVWHNPNNSTNETLRKTLGMFFPIFAGSSKKNQELFDDAVLPTLKAIYNAPDMSPLSDIKINIVVDFFVELTSPRYLLKTNATEYADVNLHDSLAFKLLNEALCDDSDDDWIRILSKFLTLLHISTQNETNVKSLKCLFEKVSDKVTDKVARRYLDKFGVFVESLYAKLNLTHHSVNTSMNNSMNNSLRCDDNVNRTATPKNKSKSKFNSLNISVTNNKLEADANDRDDTALTTNEQKVDGSLVEENGSVSLPKPKLINKSINLNKSLTKKNTQVKKSPRLAQKKTKKSSQLNNDNNKSSVIVMEDNLLIGSNTEDEPEGIFDVTVHLDGGFSSILSDISFDGDTKIDLNQSFGRKSKRPSVTKKQTGVRGRKKLSNAKHQLSASEKAAGTPDIKRPRKPVVKKEK